MFLKVHGDYRVEEIVGVDREQKLQRTDTIEIKCAIP